jgi:hypothetical protein
MINSFLKWLDMYNEFEIVPMDILNERQNGDA